MTEEELREVIRTYMAEHFDRLTIEGIIPHTITEPEAQQAFNSLVEGTFQNIISNPDLKRKLPTTKNEEVEDFVKRLIEASHKMNKNK
jgi:hypothetical protein